MEDGNKKIEGTEEEKPESLIDRFWWIIPPVFLTFVYWPFHYGHFTLYDYVRSFRYLVTDNGLPMFFWSYSVFGFMVIGYVYTIGCSLKERIIIPIFFGILGSIIGLVYLMHTYGV